MKNKKPNTKCTNCNKNIYRKPVYLKRQKSFYCCMKCQEEDKEGKPIPKIRGKNHGNWVGNKVTNKALHEWIRRYKPKPLFCEKCKKVAPYDLSNISGKYKRDVKDFKWLCRKCHMKEDGRLLKFNITKKGRPPWNKR